MQGGCGTHVSTRPMACNILMADLLRIRHTRTMPPRKTDSPATSNALEISVSELSQSLKRAIEDQFGHVRIRGEVSGYRGPHSSGHCYFALKDQNARIDAIIWKGVFGKLKIRPE